MDHVEELDHHNESVEMSYNHRNLLGHDEIEVKGTRHFEIANPSPCYNKNTNFFDDLVIIGTQLKILTTPRVPSAENIGSNNRIESFASLPSD